MDTDDGSSDEVILSHVTLPDHVTALPLQNPSPSLLALVRQLLLLMCVWNKSLPKPMVPVSSETKGVVWVWS